MRTLEKYDFMIWHDYRMNEWIFFKKWSQKIFVTIFFIFTCLWVKLSHPNSSTSINKIHWSIVINKNSWINSIWHIDIPIRLWVKWASNWVARISPGEVGCSSGSPGHSNTLGIIIVHGGHGVVHHTRVDQGGCPICPVIARKFFRYPTGFGCKQTLPGLPISLSWGNMPSF